MRRGRRRPVTSRQDRPLTAREDVSDGARPRCAARSGRTARSRCATRLRRTARRPRAARPLRAADPQRVGSLAATARRLLARLARLAGLLVTITFLTFVLTRLVGGDVVTARMEITGVLPADLADSQRHALGLDRPLIVQYLSWLADLTTFGGASMVTGQPVFPAFASRLPATLALMAVSLAATLAVSVSLGTLAAFRRGRWVDVLVRVGAFVGNALPGFLIALLGAYLLGVRLGWLPVVSRGTGPAGIVLPALTLTVSMSAKYTRQIRSAVAEELAQPYARAAWARGLPAWRVAGLVLEACLPTVVTLAGLSVGSLLGGTAIIESVFMWDGVGAMAVDAIAMRDYPVLLTYVMWMAIGYVAVGAVADALAGRLDPRARQA